MDFVLIARVVTFLFFLWVVHGVLCHAGLAARLLLAIATRRTVWPGPVTICANKQEAIARRRRFAPPPSLYPQYLRPVAGMTFAAVAMGAYLRLTLTLPLNANDQAVPWVIAVAGTLFLYFRFARRAGFYEAMVEWTLTELPRQAQDTDEPSEDVAHAFLAIRKGVRRICTSSFLAGLSALFMWGVWHNPHVRFSEAAIAQPAAGPLTSEHVERAANQGVVTFVSHPSIRVSPAPGARLMAAVGVGTLEDGHTVLVMKSGRTDLTNAASLEPLSALVYRPEWRLPLPGLGAEYPNAIAAIATKDELERFAKWERTKNMLFVLLYVGFMGHAVYVVISMRRWLRVSRLKKGVHGL
jgi:hypothetical protein